MCVPLSILACVPRSILLLNARSSRDCLTLSQLSPALPLLWKRAKCSGVMPGGVGGGQGMNSPDSTHQYFSMVTQAGQTTAHMRPRCDELPRSADFHSHPCAPEHFAPLHGQSPSGTLMPSVFICIRHHLCFLSLRCKRCVVPQA